MCLVWQSVLQMYLGMVETGPFFVKERTVDWGGGGLAVFLNKYLGRQTP